MDQTIHNNIPQANNQVNRSLNSTLVNQLSKSQRIFKEAILARRGEKSLIETQQFLDIHQHQLKIIIEAIKSDIKLPERTCHITKEKITMPVRLKCGHVFQQSAIQQWFSINETCPFRCNHTFTRDDANILATHIINETSNDVNLNINEIGKELGIRNLTYNEIKRIEFEICNFLEPFFSKIENIGSYNKFISVKGTQDILIYLPLIFPTNNVGSDPFSSIFKTSLKAWLPYMETLSIISTALINTYEPKHLCKSSQKLSEIYNSVQKLTNDEWLTRGEIMVLKNDLKILYENTRYCSNDLVVQISAKIGQLEKTLCSIIKDRNELIQNPLFIDMMYKVKRKAFTSVLGINIGSLLLQSASFLVGEQIEKSNKNIQLTLKKTAAEISSICNSSKSDKDDKFRLTLTILNKTYAEFNPSWTIELKLNYYMLSSFLNLVLDDANEALKITEEGLAIPKLYNNPFLLYYRMIAFLMKGNIPKLKETISSLRTTNFIEISDTFESYLDLKDKDEWSL